MLKKDWPDDWYPTVEQVEASARDHNLAEAAAEKGWAYKSQRDHGVANGLISFQFISLLAKDGSSCLRTINANSLEEAISLLTPPRW